MIGHGSHDLPEGSWSDDTSMMLALSDTILGEKGFEKYSYANKTWMWYYRGDYTPKGR